MLEKPHCGWSRLTLGDNSWRLSYVNCDLPIEWLLSVTRGLSGNEDFYLWNDKEGSDLHCNIHDDYCQIYDTLEEKEYIIPVSKIQFCKWLLMDIDNYFGEWLSWDDNSSWNPDMPRFKSQEEKDKYYNERREILTFLRNRLAELLNELES
ncbi:hypothetical protein FYJ78_00615 [Selenomonas sp. WCA-380-WT-3B 3/]|uniref:Uncharacterized protein n=1 Tax=Selenomonas montiformis TaxID=2652285 RepID=A0A6I2UWQ7_9FIRM|nr:hypothetical protein [Selenomonas montiformis]MSV23716.1 hypothetical protein [Selenomonas montiformis]